MESSDLDADPLRQLSAWMEQARQAGEPLAEAMALATTTADGDVSARMMIMRGLDSGVVFFTDGESGKGADLVVNPRAAALFHWLQPAHRQVRVTGPVERLRAEECDAYWVTRPPGVRRSVVASHQSSVIESRAELDARLAALAREAPDDADLARPDRWNGWRIVPEALELWQEGGDRLHDRLRYVRHAAGWRLERLSP